MRNAVLVGFVLTSLAACTSVDPNAPSQVRNDNEYTTGSNIPRRSHSGNVQVMTKEQAEELMRAKTGMPARRGM
jgi:hypothetical protein